MLLVHQRSKFNGRALWATASQLISVLGSHSAHSTPLPVPHFGIHNFLLRMASNGSDCPVAEIGNLSSPPQAGQIIRHQNVEYQTVKEGLAFILTPRLQPPSTTAKKASKSDERSQSVFYNPIQQFNRDLSVLAIRAYG